MCESRWIEISGTAIFHFDDLVERIQKLLGESFYVQPLERWPFFKEPEIKVEAININDRPHGVCSFRKKQKPQRISPQRHYG
jgi:hypothetical protein